MEPVMREVVDLVVEDGETVEEVMHGLAGDSYDLIEWKVIKEVGPGGGYPVVMITGGLSAMIPVMDRYANGY